MTDISIVIASHNGSQKLPETLNALAHAEDGGLGLQFVFVDNASVDDTFAHFNAFGTAHPVRVLKEPRKGKSYALNLALGQCEGEFIAFVDDDMTVSTQWLQAFMKAAAAHPDCAVFTGQIRPRWSRQPAKWLVHLTDSGRAYGCSDIARKSGYYEYNQAKGGNMFVRRAALGATRFDEGSANYGAAGVATGGEDTKFALSVLGEADAKLWYERDALAHHYIKPDELKLRTVLRRYVQIGETRAKRLSSLGQTDKISPPHKAFFKALKVIAYCSTAQFGRAAEEATKAAMYYGERRYLKNKREHRD